MIIPEVVNGLNVYDGDSSSGGERLVGISDEISLPSFDMVTCAVTGAGILGEIEDPVMGQFKSTEIEVPFNTMTDDTFELMAKGSLVSLNIRGSFQNMTTETSENAFTQIRIVIKGKLKGFEAGKAKIGEGTGSKLKLELLYFKLELGGNDMLELDKLNSVYKVMGRDMLQDCSKYW